MLLNDIRYAARWLRRSPGFALAAILSFAIGIGINTALFSIVDAVLFRPLPFANSDRLVDVFTSGSDGDRYATSSYPDFLDLRSQSVVFDDMIGYSPMIAAVNQNDRTRLTLGEVVTGNYFRMLGVRAAIGRTLLPEDDSSAAERVVMISDRYWHRELGSDPQVLGRTVRIRGRIYTIVGVAPRVFTGMIPILSSEMWLPVVHVNEFEPAGIIEGVPSPTGTSRLDRRGQRWMFLKGRLKAGVTLAQARANLEMVMRQLASTYPQTNRDRVISVLSTSDVRIHPDASAVIAPIAAGLMVIVGLVLLIACANVASMLLARASARRREISIRLALGASRGRLVRQLMTESSLLALFGAAAGVALAMWLIRFVTTVELPIPFPLTLDLRIDLRVLAFTLGVTLLASLAAGLAPAWRAALASISQDLRGDAPSQKFARRFTLRDALVAGQIAVTLVLLIAAGLLVRSLFAAQQANVGFRTEGLAIVSAAPDMLGYDEARSGRFWDQALVRVRALPGVESVALAGRLPFSLNWSVQNFYVPGYHGTTERGTPIQNARVSPDYFRTLGIPMLQGRAFLDSDTPQTPAVAVINETMAQKFWPRENPIGRRIHLRGPDGPAFEIVGISADYRLRTIGEGSQPFVHLASTQQPSAYYVLVARTRSNAVTLLSDVRRELLRLEPNMVLMDNQTMEAQVSATLLPARAGAWVVSVLGSIAMALAAIGLYGVISYSVVRRTREIGVRIALGATPSSVLALVMRQGLKVALVGLATGSFLAAAASRLLGGVLYSISSSDPTAWLTATAVLLSVSALANLLPARRASRVDPCTAMRVE